MPLLEFEDARQRLRRAKAHRETIAKLWNDRVMEENLYSIGVTVDDDGAGRIWIEPRYGWGFTLEVSLELGEMLYQLRAALDSCIYGCRIRETGQNPPPNENKLEFPICKSHAEFNSFDRAPLADERRVAIIELVQPYNVPDIAPEHLVFNPNRSLGILNEWARIDRHRRLHVLGTWASDASPKIICPEGTRLLSFRVSGSGFLENNGMVAEFRLAGFQKGMAVKANPDVALDIGINESPPPCAESDTFGNRLRTMLRAVYEIVCTLEATF